MTDDGDGDHRLLPQEQLFTGKDLTVPIERDNSNIRHVLARFRRSMQMTIRYAHLAPSNLKDAAVLEAVD